MEYDIKIDEDQRVLLAHAIAVAIGIRVVLDRSLISESQRDNLAILGGLLEDLPREEAEHPGSLHGFCL